MKKGQLKFDFSHYDIAQIKAWSDVLKDPKYRGDKFLVKVALGQIQYHQNNIKNRIDNGK